MFDLKRRVWLPSDMQLAYQEVAPERADWFARTRLNVIDWYPQTTLNAVCVALLCLIAGRDLGLSFCAFVVALGLLPTVAVHILYHQARAGHAVDHVRVLWGRAVISTANAAVWSGLFGWALATTNGLIMAAVLALALYRMMMTALICFSIPFVGTLNLFLLSCGIGAGLIVSGGWAGFAIAAIVALAGHSFYSVSFNLYYMFATRRLRTRTLREANETVHLLLSDFDENSSDWLWQTDKDGNYVEPSVRFAQAAGVLPSELAKLRIGHMAHHGTELRKLYGYVRAGEAFRDHQLPVKVGEETRWWSVSGKPLNDSEGQIIGYRGFASDVTLARQAEERISHMAHYDVLTGLGNRAMFSVELDRRLSRLSPEVECQHRDKRHVAVLYVDLDHFKTINDGYGHGIGDQLLAIAAQRIAGQIAGKGIAARLGGDEFAVILTGISDSQSVIAIGQAIVDAVSAPMEIERLRLEIGASVGIAFAPGDADTRDNLLRCADLALYHAKEQGRGCLSVYDRDMHEAMQERRQMTSDLRLAISRGELALHYQPLIEIKTGEVQGYEALLRWQHPTLGAISPADFIPIAEETGLIVPIGEWVIRTGLDELASWPEHLSMAINLSPIQIRSDNLIPVLIQSLASSGVAPPRVELEITESVLLHDSEDNVAVLHRLREMGLRIALDDFGTGYSSLNYLRSFPFDKIKIDRTFVDSLNDRPENQAIVDAVVGLAANLNMGTTAEGVESLLQLEELKRNGCVQAQGFLFDRAQPSHLLPFERVKKCLKLGSQTPAAPKKARLASG